MGGAFTIGTGERDNTLVYLDAGNNTIILEHLDKRCAIIGFLVEGLVEENDTRDVLCQWLASGEEQLAVLTAIILVVLHANVGEAFAHGS